MYPFSEEKKSIQRTASRWFDRYRSRRPKTTHHCTAIPTSLSKKTAPISTGEKKKFNSGESFCLLYKRTVEGFFYERTAGGGFRFDTQFRHSVRWYERTPNKQRFLRLLSLFLSWSDPFRLDFLFDLKLDHQFYLTWVSAKTRTLVTFISSEAYHIVA